MVRIVGTDRTYSTVSGIPGVGLWDSGSVGEKRRLSCLLHSTLVPVAPLVRYSICHADRDRL